MDIYAVFGRRGEKVDQWEERGREINLYQSRRGMYTFFLQGPHLNTYQDDFLFFFSRFTSGQERDFSLLFIFCEVHCSFFLRRGCTST